MGFNTVAFALNDCMHELIKSPNAVIWGLCHPPIGDDPSEISAWRKAVLSVAQAHGERTPQGFRVLPTFHADCLSFFAAGRNTISELKVVRFSKDNNTRTVTLELPDWWPE